MYKPDNIQAVRKDIDMMYKCMGGLILVFLLVSASFILMFNDYISKQSLQISQLQAALYKVEEMARPQFYGQNLAPVKLRAPIKPKAFK